MDRRIVVVLAVLALLPSVHASHATGTLPLLDGSADVDRLLDWVRDHPRHARSLDCRFRPDNGDCSMNDAAWWTIGLAHAGADPTRWPAPEEDPVDWMLHHPDRFEDASAAGRAPALGLSIVAVRAAGLDPYAVPTVEGPRDLVDELLDEHDAGHFGDTRDDIVALLGLNAAGYTGSEVDTTILHIEAGQDRDGGWGFNAAADPSVDMTAWAVAALAPHDRDEAVSDALAYLDDAQIRDGEHRACWPNRPGGPASAESTAEAVKALTAAGEDPTDRAVDGRTPTTCLLGLQDPAGWFRTRAGSDQKALHYQVLSGLSWRPYGQVPQPTQADERSRTVRAGSALTVRVDDGILRVDRSARSNVTVQEETETNLTLHGIRWSDLRPIEVDVHVLPRRPAAPNVTAPARVDHGDPFPLHLTGDRWTRQLHVRLPNGTVRQGADPTIVLHRPGRRVIEAWATNQLKEPGPIVDVEVQVRNRPPTLGIAGPDEAPRTGPVQVSADTGDPDDDRVRVRWTVDGVPAGSGPHAILEPGPPGEVTIRALAADPWGARTSAETTLLWRDRPPTVRIVGPGRTAPGPTRFLARGSDPDGDPVNRTWRVDGEVVGQGANVRIDLPAGNRSVSVTAETPYAAARATRRVDVRPGSLAVEAAWRNGTLHLDADADRLRAAGSEGPPPLRIDPPADEEVLHVTALRNGTTTARGQVVVPPPPDATEPAPTDPTGDVEEPVPSGSEGRPPAAPGRTLPAGPWVSVLVATLLAWWWRR